jgi:hypothetical protein
MKISVVYITNGKKLEITNLCIKSALRFADEVIVVGNVDDIDNRVIKISEKKLANTGYISKMRNIGRKKANGDIIINADDDILFPHTFKKKLIKYYQSNTSFRSTITKIFNIDGSRYWDRCFYNNDGVSYMKNYNNINGPNVYYSGAFIIQQKDFVLDYKWDDNLKYYEKEDVEFSNILRENGEQFNIDLNNYIIHMDNLYTAYINSDGYEIVVKKNNLGIFENDKPKTNTKMARLIKNEIFILK